MVNTSNSRCDDPGSFPGWGGGGGVVVGGMVTNLVLNFEGFNEVIIGSEAEMRGYMVKYGERLLEGGRV